MRCCVCGERSWDLVTATRDVRFSPQGPRYEVVRCRSCGVMATREGDALVDSAGRYPAEYGAFGAPRPTALRHARARRHAVPLLSYVARSRLAWLAEVPEQPGLRVLEVGCATGKIALALQRARGWDAVGIEPDPGAAAAARAEGLTTHTGTLDDYPGGEPFDLVLFVHVLEHLSDPLAALRRARALLAPRGRLVVAVPNAEGLERRLFGPWWDGWDVPRHVHHFGPRALCGLLERAELVPGKVRYEWYSLLARSLANRWRGELPYAARRAALPLGPLELAWGFALAAFRASSAIQVVATAV